MIHTSGLVGLTDFVEAEFGRRTLRESYRASGLAVDVEKQAPGFIPETAIIQFMAATADLIGDEHAGLHFARNVSFQRYGMWGTYLMQSETLGDCMTRLRRIVPLHTPYDGVRCEWHRDRVWLRQRFPSRAAPDYLHLAWATLGIFVDLCRHFLGPDWLPLELEVDLPKPLNAGKIEEVFPVPIRYDAEQIGVAIPLTAMSASRPLDEVTTVTFGDVMRERGPQRELGFASAVEEAIQVQVRAGHVSMEDTARMFSMGTRAFQRVLGREGLTFRQITNAIKISRACALLSETSLPIKSVALELGYNQVPSFTRAFTSRMKVPPTEWRKLSASRRVI